MKFLRFASFLFAVLLVLVAEKDICAQWKNMAPLLLTAPTNHDSQSGGSVIISRNGILWAGFSNVWMSKDTGRSWRSRSPFTGGGFSPTVMDIAFYNDQIGAVATTSTIYLTKDQGLSWKIITPPSSIGGLDAVCFAGSAENIAVCDDYGDAYSSTDGGQTWRRRHLSACVFDIHGRKSGNLQAITGQLFTSADLGSSWNSTTGTYDWDSYSFGEDLCDSTIFYIANEEIIAPVNNVSEIWVTTNSGTSWQSHSTHTLPYYCGSLSVAPKAIYTQTYFGVERSTDHGTTWQSIGGPPNTLDTRCVAAVNNNIVFAVDSTGSIWGTFNSGGNPTAFPIDGTMSISPQSLFDHDTIHCNDSLIHSIAFDVSGCNPPSVANWSFIGKDSLSYAAGSFSYDSLHIRFLPKHSGQNSASLVITLTDGTTDTIILNGYKAAFSGSLSIAPQSLFDRDTVQCNDSVIRPVAFNRRGCLPPSLDRWKIAGADSLSYTVGGITADSLHIHFLPKDTGQSAALLILTFNDGTLDTVALHGYKSGIPNSLSIAPRSLFDEDTVECNDSIMRLIALIKHGCTPPSVSHWTIIGADSLSYSISGITANSFDIQFQPTHPGKNAASLLITLSDGTTDTVTLNGYKSTISGSLSISPRSLFDKDTVQCNDSIIRSIVFFKHGCLPPSLDHWVISGADSLSYAGSGITADSLRIDFLPKHTGKNTAFLIVTLSDGTADTIALNGYKSPVSGSVSIAPQSLFDNDTITCNDSLIRSIAFIGHGCLPPSVLRWSIIGADSISYSGYGITSDTLRIQFLPKHAGKNAASLIITFTDNTYDTIPLSGFNNGKIFTYSSNPQSLFGNDSLYLCDKQRSEQSLLLTGGCLPKIISQTITGSGAKDYTILKQIGDPLTTLDSVLISFEPSDTGARSASYEIAFDNGTILSIPLQGFGIAARSLSLATTDVVTDMVGGSVNIPVTINGLGHPEDIDLVLHYDKELTYHGSFSQANTQLDIPNEQWVGRSKLHIVGASPNTIAGYARFDVFDDSSQNPQVTFDSVAVLTAVAPCQYLLPAATMSTITPPSGCGFQTISRFMHDGILPQLSILPNPTGGEISITSTGDLGQCSVAIYDMLGVNLGSTNLMLSQNTPAKLTLPAANGVYYVIVLSAERTYDLRAVVSH